MHIRIHDRYIFRTFIVAFALSLSIFSILLAAYLIASEFSTFVDHGASWLQVALYLVCSLGYYLVLLLPFAIVLSSYAGLHVLMRRGEMIPLLASGVPRWRVAAPILVFAFVTAVFAFLWGEFVAADASARARDIMDNQVEGQGVKNDRKYGRWIRIEGNRIVQVGMYDNNNHILYGTTVLKLNDNSSEVSAITEAATADWKDGQWIFRNAFHRAFDNGQESYMLSSAEVRIKGAIGDYSALATNPYEMTYLELSAFINMLKREGEDVTRFLPDLYVRLAFPLASFILCFIAVGAALSHRGEGLGTKNLGLVIAGSIGYYALVAFLLSLGRTGTLPPSLAVALPDIIFGLIGAGYLAWVNGQ